MSRGHYRLVESVTTDTGEPCVVPSDKWKQELMTPDLRQVRSPLNTRVWRYMRFDHFESMLRQEALYFPRVDQLGDPAEGSFSASLDMKSNPVDGLSEDQKEKLLKSHRKLRRETMQRLFYVSCWHMNEFESELLWERYMGKHKEAVAIASSVAALCTLRPTLRDTGRNEYIPRMYAGEVQYIDHSIPDSVPRDQLSLFFKANHFSGDREFRCIVELWNMGWSQHDKPDLPSGVIVPMAPFAIIDKIVIKPSSNGLKDKVNKLLDELGFDLPVGESKLEATPVW